MQASGFPTLHKCTDKGVFQIGEGNTKENWPEIVTVDIEVCEGIVHVVDNVILPIFDESPVMTPVAAPVMAPVAAPVAAPVKEDKCYGKGYYCDYYGKCIHPNRHCPDKSPVMAPYYIEPPVASPVMSPVKSCDGTIGEFFALCNENISWSKCVYWTGGSPHSFSLLVHDCSAEIACSVPEFSILCEAAKLTGVADILAGSGPFTVFAPTNGAFKKLVKALGLSGDPLTALAPLAKDGTLEDVLLFHAVAGKAIFADDLVCGGKIEMANGDFSFT